MNAGPVVLINLTPHPVTVYDGDRVVASWSPAGPFARLVELRGPTAGLDTDRGPVALVDVAYSTAVADLPEPVEGTAFLVSRVLAAAVPRNDLYFPADEVRDNDGRIVGCRALARFVLSSVGDLDA